MTNKLSVEARTKIVKKLYECSKYLTKKHFNQRITIHESPPYSIELYSHGFLNVGLQGFNNGLNCVEIKVSLIDKIILSYHWYKAHKKTVPNDFDYVKLLEGPKYKGRHFL